MSEKFVRKEARYNLKQFGLKGEIILYPNPKAIEMTFDDISSVGAGITILSNIDDGQKKELVDLVKAAKEGNKIPVQLVFNNTKIPVHLTNMMNEKSYGITVSDNQKLASLAEKGKQFFQSIVQAAMKKGAEESGYQDYPIVSMEFLADDIRNFVESGLFVAMSRQILINEIASRFAVLKNKVEGPEDQEKLGKLFFKYLAETGKDMPLLAGSTIFSLRKQNTGKPMPVESYLPIAIRHLLDGNKVFTPEERNAFERYLSEEYLKVRVPTQYKELPPKHPMAEMIKLRFDAFSRKTFFLQGLAPYVCDYYVRTFSSPDSEMVKLICVNDRLVRTTLLRWIQNELNEFASSKDPNAVNAIDDLFKQAMYEYVTRRKVTTISLEEIADLFEGKVAAAMRDIRNRFLANVCQLLKRNIEARFAEYKADTNDVRMKQESEKDEDEMIRKMSPVELMKKFCWPKILAIGETIALQREVARTWIPKETYMNYSSLGFVAVLPPPSYQEFVAASKGILTGGERPQDFFDEIDLLKIYQRIEEMPNGKKRKAPFGFYMDTLQPPHVRELLMEKVIMSPEWSKYYVVSKSKSHLAKALGSKGQPLFDIIEKNILTGTFDAKEYV